MRPFVFIVCWLCFGLLQGQKLIKKGVLSPATEFIQIDAEHCYQVTLRTSNKSNEIQVEANIEGEYAPDILVKMEEIGTTMVISAGFQPNFTNPNDKLSAHKVISIELDITVPEYKNVAVFGTHSRVDATGDYSALSVKLDSGTCTLNDVTESIVVKTQKGDINVFASEGRFSANSSYGKVNKEFIPNGDTTYNLNTVEGTILLKKTK